MKTILKFAFILFLVNLIASAILAATYNLTKSGIEKQESLVKEEALKQVMPEKIGDRIEPVKKDGVVKYWEVFKGDIPQGQGYIYIAKKYGYSSVIETMVGVKKDGTITGVRVLSQNETPGLGAKIIEIISNRTLFNALKGIFTKEEQPKGILSPYFTEQFTNRNVKELELSKGGIQAITGATISSRAVLDSIKTDGLKILNNHDE
ncbi:MAG: RnfABCDGE type electron transport complex subunit G [Candidatus Omnitrophica bacterium]|nr:RnfABCDGE type electron transport complex subunit G [Candidatus Omnitrophota bacterium]